MLFYMDDSLSMQNHIEGKDEELRDMNLKVSPVGTYTDILVCMMAEEIRHALKADNHLCTLTAYMINDWPSTRAKFKEEVKLYLTY